MVVVASSHGRWALICVFLGDHIHRLIVGCKLFAHDMCLLFGLYFLLRRRGGGGLNLNSRQNLNE